MEFKLAQEKDLTKIMNIYSNAREYMRKTGNPTQRKNNYPPISLIKKDIKEGKYLYVAIENNSIVGVFYFRVGIDETYINITNGKWLDDSEYGVIHRIASSGATRDFFGKVLEFCLTKINHIRIDTHENNAPMLKTLKRHNFSYRGNIICSDGTERVAFEYLK